MSLRSVSISAASAEVADLIGEMPRLWWMFSIRGLLTVTFSSICFFLSSSMATVLLRPAGFILLQVMLSFYVMATGIILLIGAFYAFDAKLRHRKVLLSDAAVNLAIGILFFITLHLSMQYILELFAAHSMAVGVFYMVISLRMRKQALSRLLLGACGLVSVAAGVRFILRRLVDMHVMTREVAVYTAVLGVLLLLFSIALRGDRQVTELVG